jgi:carbon storage regulator
MKFKEDSVMLVLTRKPGERIFIGSGITITVFEVKGTKIRLGIEAPDDVPISRAELGVCAGRRETPQRCFSVRCRT